MEKIQNTLEEAARLMAEIGFDQRQKNLNAEKQRISREKFKVAVIGQFKTGKSTLINKVFLKTDLLFVDHKAATAVPTEIEYAPAPAVLEVYPIVQVGIGATGEGTPRRMENPSTEDLKRETSHETDEGSAALAKQT